MTIADIGTVLITGAQGNLGRKLIAHLVAGSWCERVIGVDRAIGQEAAGLRTWVPPIEPWATNKEPFVSCW